MVPDRTRFDYLDGLRGWAAFSVVIYHSSWETFGVALPGIRTTLLGPLNDGAFAVAVFFVLSGFVLSRHFMLTKDRAALQRMAAGRYVRLAVPVAIISSIGFLMAMSGTHLQRAAGAVVGSDWFADALNFPLPPGIVSFVKFCIYNVFTGLRPAMEYNQFTWTMTYELCGSYMLFATLALFGDGMWLRRLALALMLGITYRSDPLYALFFGGALLAEINVAWQRPIANAAANVLGLALALSVWAVSAFARGEYTTIPALMLLASLLISPWLQWAFNAGVSQWLGRISFPLYLVHGYVLFGGGGWAIVTLNQRGAGMTEMAAIVIPCSIAASLLAGRALLPVEHLAKIAARATGRFLTRGAMAKPLGRPLIRNEGALNRR